MPVVSVTGIIEEITEPKKEGKEFPVMRQKVILKEDPSGDLIQVKLAEKHHFPTDGTCIGDKVAFYASKKGDRLSGITKKSIGNKVFVSITDTASFMRLTNANDSKPKKEKEIHLNESESTPVRVPKGPCDSIIKKTFFERMYIYGIISKAYNESNVEFFPKEKLAEVATGIHIGLERSGKDILPNGYESLFAKRTREQQISEVAKAAVDESWKNAKHPTTGKKLGELSKSELLDKFCLYYYKNKDKLNLSDEVKEFIVNIGMAMRYYGITVASAVDKMISEEVTSSLTPDQVVMLVAKDKEVSAQLAKCIVCGMLTKSPKELAEYLRNLVNENSERENDKDGGEEDGEEEEGDKNKKTYILGKGKVRK